MLQNKYGQKIDNKPGLCSAIGVEEAEKTQEVKGIIENKNISA